MKNCILNLKYKSLFLLLGIVIVAHSSFAHFGSKGPFGGSVTCGTSSATTVYIGTSEGGVYESTSAALTGWRARPVGLKSGKITALTHSSSYLVAGTADSGVFIFNGYVGSDRYWNKINTGLTNLKIKALISIDTITFLVGTDGGGVFKTTNKGASWVSINNINLNNTVVTGFVKAGTRIILTSQSGGLFFSDDNGATWSDFNDVNTLNIIGANALSYNVTTDELLVLNSNGLFLSGTAATTTTPSYSAIQIGLPSLTVRSVSNNGTNWYLATNDGVYTSSTGTISWSTLNTGLSGNAYNVTTLVPFQTNLLIGTATEGLFKTTASTINWVVTNANFNNIVTYSMTSKDSLLVVAATEKGVFMSKDLAANYSRANIGLTDSLNVTDLIFSNTNLFAVTKNSGVFVSADTGKTWTSYNLGLANINVKKIVASEQHLYIILSNGTVYQSTGLGWLSIQSGLPSGVEPTSFAFYNGKILLGTLGDGVFARAEASGSWTVSNTGLTNLLVTSVTTNGSKLFVGTDGDGVFVSNLSPISWEATATLSIAHTALMGLDGLKVQAMAYYKGYVYASYKGGLLTSSDNGDTWIAGGNQFNLPSFTDVKKISFVTSRVFVTTENNSLYSNSLGELPVIVTGLWNEINEISTTAVVVSPNPNNGNFTISIDNSILFDITEVVIFDAIGATMDRMDSVQNEFSVHYPKGIYYVQVITSKGRLMKKIIVQ